MKLLLASLLGVLVILTTSARAAEQLVEGQDDEGRATETRVRALIELKDGSRLVGTPLESSLPVSLDFMKVSIPLDKIKSCEIRHKDERAVVNFLNGDRLTGVLNITKFQVDTVLGKLLLDTAQIDRMTFSAWRKGNMPPGEGNISFGGVNWTPWRTQFEIQGDKLVTLPKARPGFNYGHWGNGRSATLVTNIGSTEWKNYRVEFELGMTGVNPAFNPHGLPADYRSAGLSFHVADSKESWNVKGESSYGFSIAADGTWSLACSYNHHSPSATGWCQPLSDGARTLASGKGLKIDTEKGNKIRLDVIGTRIQIWVDDARIVDISDEKMSDTFSGQTLDHGGIGIAWGWECMGWIRNFSTTRL